MLALLLGVMTLAIYLPSLRHNFLQYDDQEYVTGNVHVSSGLTADGFAWAFGNHVSNWHPLTWLSHMLDCQIYGLRPSPILNSVLDAIQPAADCSGAIVCPVAIHIYIQHQIIRPFVPNVTISKPGFIANVPGIE